MIDINDIWDKQRSTGEIIIKTRVSEITQVDCFIATNSITKQYLFMMYISDNIVIPTLKHYRFKGVEVYVVPNDGKKEFFIYLLDDDLKDIFSLFIQNVLEAIQKCSTEKQVIEATLNIITKWKKLFDKISRDKLTVEEEKGLIGELLFLNSLLDNDKTKENAINYWTSMETDFQAKDFIIKGLGIEIKFSTANQPKIRIANEKQLDSEYLEKLFLLLYVAEVVKENGFSLNSIVQQIRQKLLLKKQLDLFNAKLQLKGYLDRDMDMYNNRYSLRDMSVFEVTSDFPKIVKLHLPIGIYDVSYLIEISAIGNYKVDFEDIFLKIQ